VKLERLYKTINLLELGSLVDQYQGRRRGRRSLQLNKQLIRMMKLLTLGIVPSHLENHLN
jgi:hypothetical protein